MTYQDVAAMVSSTGIPNAYHHFDENDSPEPPFICFYYPESNDFAADDINYQDIEHLIIELYTDNKDFQTEKTVEDALRASGAVYARSEIYIESERLYEVIFETDIIITEE